MIEPIEIEEKEKSEEVITPAIDDSVEAGLPTGSNESTDDIEAEAEKEPDAQVSVNESDSFDDNGKSDNGESVSEETVEENEDKKKIEELTASLERELAEHREEVDSLKKEIVSLSPIPNFEKDMLEELIALREGYFRMKHNYEEKDVDFFNKDKMLGLIDDIASQIETILFNYSVEMSHSNASDPYNPRIHQAIKVIPTDDEAAGGTVESSLGELYIYKGRTIQKERVNVYKLNKTNKK